MENMQIPEKQPSQVNDEPRYTKLKFKRPKPFIVATIIVVLLIIVTLFFAKGFFIAATVNGRPISRLSIIKVLEKQGAKQALEAIIDQKLIEIEFSKQNISVTQAEIDEEIKKIEEQVSNQGGTLKDALVQQGMSEEKLREQIITQKKLEKLLADKITVSPEEIDAFIKDSKAVKSKEVKTEDYRKQLSDQLKQQKFQQEAQKWMSDLTKNAKIKYYVTY